MLTIPNGSLLQYLADINTLLTTVGNVVKVHLFQNNVIPGPTDTISTYTEATFDGYSAQNMAAIGTPFVNSAGQAEQDFQTVNFTDTGAVTPNTIYGYYVGLKIGAGAETLLWSERFPAPVQMNAAGRQINIGPQLTLASAF